MLEHIVCHHMLAPLCTRTERYFVSFIFLVVNARVHSSRYSRYTESNPAVVVVVAAATAYHVPASSALVSGMGASKSLGWSTLFAMPSRSHSKTVLMDAAAAAASGILRCWGYKSRHNSTHPNRLCTIS